MSLLLALPGLPSFLRRQTVPHVRFVQCSVTFREYVGGHVSVWAWNLLTLKQAACRPHALCLPTF